MVLVQGELRVCKSTYLGIQTYTIHIHETTKFSGQRTRWLIDDIRHDNSPPPVGSSNYIYTSCQRNFWVGTNYFNLHRLPIQLHIVVSFKSLECITSSGKDHFSSALKVKVRSTLQLRTKLKPYRLAS